MVGPQRSDLGPVGVQSLPWPVGVVTEDEPVFFHHGPRAVQLSVDKPAHVACVPMTLGVGPKTLTALPPLGAQEMGTTRSGEGTCRLARCLRSTLWRRRYRSSTPPARKLAGCSNAPTPSRAASSPLRRRRGRRRFSRQRTRRASCSTSCLPRHDKAWRVLRTCRHRVRRRAPPTVGRRHGGQGPGLSCPRATIRRPGSGRGRPTRRPGARTAGSFDREVLDEHRRPRTRRAHRRRRSTLYARTAPAHPRRRCSRPRLNRK